uniref:Auxin-responsive protein n=1 Tax=Oryza glumipatula TaxID=40148 RepID=A0A0D9Y568_9ORYZ
MPVRRRQTRRRETGVAERYREMGISAALSWPWDYPTACGEIVVLLRIGYGCAAESPPNRSASPSSAMAHAPSPALSPSCSCSSSSSSLIFGYIVFPLAAAAAAAARTQGGGSARDLFIRREYGHRRRHPWRWRSGFGEEDAVTVGESGLELSLGLPAYFSSSKPSEGSTAAPAFALQYNGTTASKPREAAAAPVVGWPPVRSFRRTRVRSPPASLCLLRCSPRRPTPRGCFTAGSDTTPSTVFATGHRPRLLPRRCHRLLSRVAPAASSPTMPPPSSLSPRPGGLLPSNATALLSPASPVGLCTHRFTSPKERGGERVRVMTWITLTCRAHVGLTLTQCHVG